MTPILQAAAQGYSSQQILRYLQNAFPKLTPKILQATANGYSVDQILKFVNKLMESETFSPNTTPHEIEAANQKKYNEYGKKILGTAATGIGLTNFARQLPRLVQTLGSNLGVGTSAIGGTQPNIGPQPMANAPVQPNAPTNPQTNPPNLNTQGIQPQQQSISQTTQTIPTQTSANPQQSVSLIEQMGIGPQIQTLHAAGNNLEGISAAVGVTMKPNQRKWLDEQIKAGNAKSLPDMIGDYLGQTVTPNQPTQAANEKISPEIAENVQKQPIQQPKPKGKPQKGELVATPSGEVGTLKDVKNKEGLIDEDGKLHKVKLSDLQAPGETEVEVVERLLEIPEIDKSGPLAYWSYDDVDNELFVMYHNGETYKYLDVPEDLVQKLEEAAVIPKTKGKNLFGEWSTEQKPEFSPQAGKEIISRGATLSELFIRHPKYKRATKGEEPNPFYRKLRKGYDYWPKLRS